MKINLSYCLFLIFVLFLLFSCKKEAIKAVPSLTVAAVTNITATSATCGGEVTADGGSAVTSRGVCWSSTNLTPTTSDSKTSDGIGLGIFASSLIGLTPGTTYYLKVYATNSVGTAYYSQSSFLTLSLAPVLTSTNLSAITSSTATSGGNITSDGGSPVIARGVCWSTNQNPTIADGKTIDGTGSGNFTSSITGLTAGVTYYFRAYATNSIGTAYGNQLTTTTIAAFPVLTTNNVTNITAFAATGGGIITNEGGAAVIIRGVCWSTSKNPTIADGKTTNGSGTGNFTSSVTGLTQNTTYYLRAYATNDKGTGYGSEVSFTTLETGIGTITDIDGNVYHTVTIGTQVWMVENLKVTHYSNGDPISNVTDGTPWSTLTTGAYCWYNNAASYRTSYGALYNWYSVNDNRNIAPTGWHVPNEFEWTTIINYLGGLKVAGDKLKEAGTAHWISPITIATNESGFTALPGGRRDNNGIFSTVGITGYWWSSKESSATSAFSWLLGSDSKVTSTFHFKNWGSSVRCLRD